MAMTVLNNTAASLTIGELNKNISSLNRQHKKVSSGMKLNSAGDDASAYAISERMRAQIRSLDQDVENVKNGRALLKVAAGGIDNIIDELRNIKELAINSANDTNTDKDRATLQKEYEQKIANINDIVAETNYNGKILLDGRYGRKLGYSTGGVNGSWVASQTEPTGTPIMITSGNYTISSDGVYMLASGYQGTVTIANGVQNVKIQQQTPAVALDHTFIVGPSSGGVNLWIEDLNIQNKFDSSYPTDNTGAIAISSALKFDGSGNYLTLKGNSTFSRELDLAFVNTIPHAYSYGRPIIDAGEGLTIEAFGNGRVNVFDKPTFVRMQSTAQGWYGSPYPYAETAGGAGIGFCKNNQDAYLEINGGNINVDMAYGISDGQLTAYYNAYATAFPQGTGINSPQGRMIDDFGASAGIGGWGGNQAQSNFYGDITINDGVISSRAVGGAGIGSDGSSDDFAPLAPSIRDININGGSITSSSFLGEDIGKGYNGRIRNIIQGPSGTGGAGNSGGNIKTIVNGRPLVIQHGTRSNQAINCYIENMGTKAMGLSNTKISTCDDAIQALSDDTTGRIGAIDAAIEYALGEATNVGAYISRLEHTEENLVTANENTRASESTIRDADMAKEMTEYTKYSLLTQSSQAMLAQANQNGSQVLSLLQ